MPKHMDSLGQPLSRAVAMASRPTISGPSEVTYLCDAGFRPNPGFHLPVIWDGEAFLETEPVEGTNHRASYHAVKGAFEDADRRQAARIELRLTSDLVFRQLSTGEYCRNLDLRPGPPVVTGPVLGVFRRNPATYPALWSAADGQPAGTATA